MRRTKLRARSAHVTIPDYAIALSILYQHAKYDALKFYLFQEHDPEVEFYVEQCFNYLDITVDGEPGTWVIDKIIKDHDEESHEEFSVLLSDRKPFTRKGGDEKLTHNRYLYLRATPRTSVVVPVQAIAEATSDTGVHWTDVVKLFEA